MAKIPLLPPTSNIYRIIVITIKIIPDEVFSKLTSQISNLYANTKSSQWQHWKRKKAEARTLAEVKLIIKPE